MQKKKLVFDIEMVGEDFDALDELTKQDLTKNLPDPKIDKVGYEKGLAEIKNKLVFSPLTGKIIAIGVYDPDTKKGAVYYDTAGKKTEDSEESDIKYVSMNEAEMLSKFWALAEITSEFISFFGRRADAPYMAVRSAIHGIKPSRDLISGRYGGSSLTSVAHIDLAEALSFFGAATYRGSLHRWCRAFDIESPKGEMGGAYVGQAYKSGKYFEIAKYNAADLIATAKLFHIWERYFK